jgi:predicted nuclease of predicted toxin-antitoxin system
LVLPARPDLEIWAYAREHDFAVVSKDDEISPEESLLVLS